LKIADEFSFTYRGITEFDRKKRFIGKPDPRYHPVDDIDGLLTAFFGKKEVNVSLRFRDIAVLPVGVLHLYIAGKLVIHEVRLRHNRV
jgi:hypothetical protein